MTFRTLIGVVAPAHCRVHASFGRIALLVHEAELEGSPEFSALAFKNTRDRAMMYLPYAREDAEEHREAIDLVEYAICKHETDNHGEDYNERIGQLSDRLGTTPAILQGETLEAGTKGWWGN